MQTPWQKYPTVNSRDQFWQDEEGKTYLKSWREHLANLSEEERSKYKKENPAPFYWFFAYWQVMQMWLFLFFLFLALTAPLRNMHFNSVQKKLK